MKVLVEENGVYVLKDVGFVTSGVSSLVNPILFRPQGGGQAFFSTLTYFTAGALVGTFLGKKLLDKVSGAYSSDDEEYS